MSKWVDPPAWSCLSKTGICQEFPDRQKRVRWVDKCECFEAKDPRGDMVCSNCESYFPDPDIKRGRVMLHAG